MLSISSLDQKLTLNHSSLTLILLLMKKLLIIYKRRNNIKVGPDKDKIEMFDALRNTKYEERDSIDPGARIIIKRFPGTTFPSSEVSIQSIKRDKNIINVNNQGYLAFNNESFPKAHLQISLILYSFIFSLL